MNELKVGDDVVCIDNKSTGLSLSEKYVVAYVDRFGRIALVGFPTMLYDGWRFKKVEQDSKQEEKQMKANNPRPLKIGDKVLILDNAEETTEECGLGWMEHMEQYIGRTNVVDDFDYGGVLVFGCYWSSDCLQLLEEGDEKATNNTKTNNTISGVFHTNTRKATVAYEYDKEQKRFKLGIAYCNPRDDFVKSEGIRLAKKRLEESPEIISLKFLEFQTGGRLCKDQGVCFGFKHVHKFLPWALQSLD